MATITGVMGEPWEPSLGIRAMMASIAKTQKLLASTTAVRSHLTPLLLQQQRMAGLTASVAAAQTAMKPLLDALDRSQLQQIAAGLPSVQTSLLSQRAGGSRANSSSPDWSSSDAKPRLT